MRFNRTAALGLVICVAGAVALGVFVVSPRGSDEAGADAEETVAALITTADLRAETDASALVGAVEQVAVPVSLAPQRRIDDLGTVSGQRLIRTVGTGELLTADHFTMAGPVAGGVSVTSGYEAMAVEAEPAPGVEGYVTPGTRVNVYGTFTEESTDEETGATSASRYTQLVLAHVDVLAVTRGTLTGEARDPAAEQPDARIVLLLEVRDADVPVMIFAETHGNLWFTIANDDDEAPEALRVQLDALEPGLRTEAIGDSIAAQRSRADATATSTATDVDTGTGTGTGTDGDDPDTHDTDPDDDEDLAEGEGS